MNPEFQFAQRLWTRKWIPRATTTAINILFVFSLSHSQFQWTQKLAGAGLSLAFNPQNPQTAFAGILSTRGRAGVPQLHVSHDGGEHWMPLWIPSTDKLIFGIAIHPVDTMTMFVATRSKGLWKSTDGGENWSLSLDSVGFAGDAIVFNPVSPEIMYVGTIEGAAGNKRGFWTSTDRGSTWTVTPSTSAKSHCTIAIRPDSINVLYAGLEGGEIAKTTDGGATWRTVYMGPGGGEVPKIVIDPKNPFQAYAVFYGPPRGLWKTINGGESWFRSGLENSSLWSVDVDPNNPAQVFAGELDTLGRMFRSTDAGQSWQDISNGLPYTKIGQWSVKIASANPSLALAAVFGDSSIAGVYKVEGVLLSVQESMVPEDFHLEQNYPNPFNPSTTIRFTVSHAGPAELKVFNLLGREVATLVNTELSPGSYSITWSAHGQPSGVYFYRLVAKGVYKTKKLVVLR